MHYNFLRHGGPRHLVRTARLAPLFAEPVNIEVFLAGFRDLMQDVVGPNCLIALRHDPGGYAVAIEPWSLQMILLELLMNAVDATPDGGVLTISTRPVCVADDYDLVTGDYMRLSVADPGCGMSGDVALRAFDPFFTTKKSRLGLGLSQAAELLAVSGGRAQIESGEVRGTIVHLYLRRGHELIVTRRHAKAIVLN